MAKSKPIGTEAESAPATKKWTTGHRNQAKALRSPHTAKALTAAEERRKAERMPEVSADDILNAVREASVTSSVFLSRLVIEGIPVATASAFETVVDGMVAHAVLPRKTWQDARVSASKRLSTQNSERLIRTLKAIVAANDAFGEARGEAWLLRPTEAFEGMTPMAMLATESGADAVQALLGRVKYGMTA